ncbi:MAG: flavin reductase family protein [Deltaproteobacteria bacterium]|nr:flavin reductase family protein [Deltaproteobacteria bacterium]
MPIDKQTFRRVLGSFAAGVTVVTTLGEDGQPYGLTATAFTSVSLEPPLVLVCVDKRSESHVHCHASKVFAVNFLSRDQEDLSRRFAVSGGDKFGDLPTHRSATGAPLLHGSAGYVDCCAINVIDAGDHTVFIGQVESADCSDAPPLLYFRGAYGEVKPKA